MKKFDITVSFGEKGFNKYGGFIAILRLLRKYPKAKITILRLK